MDITTYQPLARRTMKELPFADHMQHMGIGLTGELGEFADAVKKNVIYNKDLDLVNLSEEAGDLLWYAVGLQPELQVPLTQLEMTLASGAVIGGQQGLKSAIVLVTFVQSKIANSALVLMSLDPTVSGQHGNELRDIFYHLGILFGYFGLDFAKACDANIAKLSARYGDKYSDLAALNRDTTNERGVLEKALAADAVDASLAQGTTTATATTDTATPTDGTPAA